MNARTIHRWLGLTAGSLALVLGITGAILAWQPLQEAWRAMPVAPDLPVSTLVARVSATVPGIEEIRRQPSGDIVVYAFEGDQARAVTVDPADGRVLGDYQTSGFARWIRNLHRSFLLDDAGRLAAAAVALALFLLSVTGLTLMARRMGGWRRLGGRVRGTTLQRIHAVAGRILIAVLCLSSITALYMSATTFNLIPTGAEQEPAVLSAVGGGADVAADQLPLLRALRAGELRRLNFPSADDPQDTWKIVTDHGAGWIDRHTGRTLAWQPAPLSQRINDWVMLLHTGEGAGLWALVLAVLGAGIPLFWGSGLVMWWQGRRQGPRITANSALAQADTLIFVASEGGSTWGFAQALQQALMRAGHRVHVAGLENFRLAAATRRVFVLAATYGDGQAPTHAARALPRIAAHPVGAVPVTVLGFGDRQFAAFCAYAQAVDHALRARGWPQLLPLECIHQQSPQQFDRWCAALAQVLGEPLAPDYVPRVPPTTSLVLESRQDHPGGDGGPTAILRFRQPPLGWRDRIAGRGLPRFKAGDLVAILAPDSSVPRHYSLASSHRNGFLEICVRRMPGGLCSGYLHDLRPGDSVRAYIKPNPGFTLDGKRQPVVLIGAGTGVAPLAGFIRDNHHRVPMHLYYGARDPEQDFYYGQEIQHWLGDRRLASLRTAFSRVPQGGGYVQDVLRRDAARIRDLVSRGAVLRVCGSRSMARGVVEALDAILGTLNLSVQQLKLGGRYAEDVF